MVSPKQFTDYITVVLNVSSAFFFCKKEKKITPTNKLFEVAHHVWTKKKIKVISLYYSPPIFLVSILYHILISFIEKSPLSWKKEINFFLLLLCIRRLLTINAQHLHKYQKTSLVSVQIENEKTNLCGEAINYQVSISKGFVNTI